jgi:hypothetical protein
LAIRTGQWMTRHPARRRMRREQRDSYASANSALTGM